MRDQKDGIELRPGAAATVAFSVERGVLVRGVLCDAGNRPRPYQSLIVRYGVRDQWNESPERPFVAADDRGRFEARVLPGWISLEYNVDGENQASGAGGQTSLFARPGETFDLGNVQLGSRGH